LECRTLEVPVDNADPSGPTWTIHVSRWPARTQSAPLSALLLNEGGPGPSGLHATGYKKAWSELHALEARSLGHLSFWTNTCASRQITTFLLDGSAPRQAVGPAD
jgi:hypothetical protein